MAMEANAANAAVFAANTAASDDRIDRCRNAARGRRFVLPFCKGDECLYTKFHCGFVIRPREDFPRTGGFGGGSARSPAEGDS